MSEWSTLLELEKKSKYFKNAWQYSNARREIVNVFPPKEFVFETFQQTSLSKLKVVVIGQDPYHGPDQAHGLCFSVNKGVKIPPSLKNIYKELESDLGIKQASHGCLTRWAEQGVLLLNSVLTVESGKANSHRNIGWQQFTDSVIGLISQNKEHVVFLLWGSSAQAKRHLIDDNKHTILTAVHPSPLSAYRGFLGCKHFSKTNEALITHHQDAIDWYIPE